MDDELFEPKFDQAEFRIVVAGYIRSLLQARLALEPDFLQEHRDRWAPLQSVPREDAWKQLHGAALLLKRINHEFIPRCGSGGIPIMGDTPVTRLMDGVAFLVNDYSGGPDHNGSLIDAGNQLRNGGTINWDELVNWSSLPQIRDDLDTLPEPNQTRNAAHEVAPSDPNVFRRLNSGWQIRFDGGDTREIDEDLVGLEYIRLLVSAPGQGFRPSELINQTRNGVSGRRVEGSEVSVDAASVDLATDRDTLREVDQRLENVNRELELARNDNNDARVDELAKEKLELLEYVRSSTFNGNPRQLNSAARRDADAAKKAINRAVEKISKKNPSLGTHLHNSIRLKDLVSYHPDRETLWIT